MTHAPDGKLSAARGREQAQKSEVQELRIAPAKSLKTVRWVGSVREEQIRKAVFGRRRRAKKPGRTRQRHGDESAGTAAQKGTRRWRESSEGGQAGARMRGGSFHNER